MLTRLYIVVNQEDEDVVNDVKKTIFDRGFSFSFSPSREQPSLADCLDFFGTADLNEKEIDDLLDYLNNDWDGQKDDCSAYGFNTKMFHPDVYYIQFQIQ